MESTRRLVSVVALGLVGLGCSTAGEPGGDPLDSSADGSGPSGSGSGAGGSGGGQGGTGNTGNGAVTEGTVGMVVIDVQETFVDGAASADMPGIIARTKSAFSLAEKHDVPFFITFEDSQQGDHALHAPLQPALPSQAQDFVKTTFAATGLPAFAAAVQQAGLSHIVVLGAETDVCVLQTVLGLRTMGFTVMLEQDAVFTEETNTSPALRRMQQAGTFLVNETDVAGYVANPTALPKGGDRAVRITKPLALGVVLHDFTDAAIAGSADPHASQKSARLRELLLVSEWFELPVYVEDVAAGLPAAYEQYFWGQLRPITQIGQDAFVEQLVFAGSDGGLAGAMSAWTASHELFVMEDALLAVGSSLEPKDMLTVPTTYKSFWYDMTQSVNPAEWPSQEWVQKLDEYYPITQAPEDLPSIPGE